LLAHFRETLAAGNCRPSTPRSGWSGRLQADRCFRLSRTGGPGV